jgi:hypothetical protein
MASEFGANPFGKKTNIPHYYGDTIRNLFISAGIIYAVAMPLWGNLLPVDTFTGIFMILILVFLAGITNPRSTTLMFVNVFVAGAGVFYLQWAAITFYETQSPILFFLREAVVILLLFAFYHSVKSSRNMMLGKVGAKPTPGEFEKR